MYIIEAQRKNLYYTIVVDRRVRERQACERAKKQAKRAVEKAINKAVEAGSH